jgi:hypothetical protein
MFDTSPLAQLWTRARAMFARACDIIGPLERLAALAVLTRKRRYEIATWIARLECIARKLLFAEASRLDVLQTSSSRTRASAIRSPGATSARLAPAFDPTQPETWPARFKLAPPRDPLAVPESRAPRIRALWGSSPPPPPSIERAAAHKTPAPLHFAFRVEALRRVLENPLPHAQRLARIFHRLQRRFPEAALRYATATARPHAIDPGDPRLIVDALSLALSAAPLFANTS